MGAPGQSGHSGGVVNAPEVFLVLGVGGLEGVLFPVKEEKDLRGWIIVLVRVGDGEHIFVGRRPVGRLDPEIIKFRRCVPVRVLSANNRPLLPGCGD